MIKPKFTHNTLRWGLLSVALACIASMPVWADDAPDSGEDLVPEPIFPADITVGEATYTVDLVNPADTFAGLNITGYAATGTELLIPAELTIPEELHPGQLVLPVAAVTLPTLDKTYATITIEKADAPLTVNTGFYDVTKATTLNLYRNISNGVRVESAFGSKNLDKIPSIRNVNFGDAVTAIADYAFYNCDISALTLPDSLETIGKNSFSYMRRLASVSFPKSLKVIDNYAFDYCQRLSSIEFTDTIDTIGEYAFRHCDRLKSITILADNILPRAFDKCQYLSEVSAYGNGSVQARAFADCDSLTTTYFDYPVLGTVYPDKDIPNDSVDIFYGCDKVKYIGLGDKVKSVEQKAFANHSTLTDITFGRNLETIKSAAFNKAKFKEIIFPSDSVPNPVMVIDGLYTDEGAVVSLGNRMKEVKCISGNFSKLDLGNSVQRIVLIGNADTIVVPPNVQYLGSKAFTNNTEHIISKFVVEYSEEPLQWSLDNSSESDSPYRYVKELIVNRTINPSYAQNSKRIRGLFDPYKLGNCQLGIDCGSKIDIPKWLVLPGYFGMSSRQGNHPTLHIGPMVRSIKDSALIYPTVGSKPVTGTLLNEKITFIMDEGIEEIESNAINIPGIYNDASVLVVPASMKVFDKNSLLIGDKGNILYTGNIDYKKIILKGSSEPLTIKNGSSSRYSKVTELFIDRPLDEESAKNLLTGSPLVDKVVFGDNVREIPANMFKDRANLITVIVSDSIESIGEHAFENCTGMKNLSLSENLKTIGDNAYNGCTNFERIVSRGVIPAEGQAGFGADVEDYVPLYVPRAAIENYESSPLFRYFYSINPFGQDVAVDVVVDEENTDAQEYVDKLDESEPGTTINGPKFIEDVILECYEEPIESLVKANAKAASARAVAPELYWVSLDPTVASVDQQGNVTINKKAPVEIRAYLLDGSDKYASFGVNQPALLGDLNRDKVVNTADLNAMINHVAAPEGSTVKLKVADMNGDGEINAADINIHINQCVTTE